MQSGADKIQQGFIGFDLPDFKGGGQAVFGQLVPAVAQTRRLRDPQNNLQISQTAGRFLAVGLQRIGRVFKLVVPLAKLQCFGNKKCFGVHHAGQLRLQIVKAFLVANDQTCLHQRGLHGDIFGGFFSALGRGSHAGANLQTAVPAVADELLNLRFQVGVVINRTVIWQQKQHVYIGVRKQLTAAVAAHCYQAGIGCKVRQQPQFLQSDVGVFGQLLQHAPNAAS